VKSTSVFNWQIIPGPRGAPVVTVPATSARFEASCATCRHDGWPGCAAFPRGIPLRILSGEVDHLAPLAGDGGVVYAPRPDLLAGLLSA